MSSWLGRRAYACLGQRGASRQSLPLGAGVAWTPAEHKLFLLGLQKLGKVRRLPHQFLIRMCSQVAHRFTLCGALALFKAPAAHLTESIWARVVPRWHHSLGRRQTAEEHLQLPTTVQKGCWQDAMEHFTQLSDLPCHPGCLMYVIRSLQLRPTTVASRQLALEQCPHMSCHVLQGDWRGISRHYVTTRTPTQVASHAQKHYMRQSNVQKRKRRSSLFDMVPDDDEVSS